MKPRLIIRDDFLVAIAEDLPLPNEQWLLRFNDKGQVTGRREKLSEEALAKWLGVNLSKRSEAKHFSTLVDVWQNARTIDDVSSLLA